MVGEANFEDQSVYAERDCAGQFAEDSLSTATTPTKMPNYEA